MIPRGHWEMTTLSVQHGNNVLLPNAAGETGIKYNKVFTRPLPVHGKKKDDRCMGIFHEFTPELADCILWVAVEDAPDQRERNNEDLECQEEARLVREDYIKAKGLEKAKKELVRAYMFYDMYNTEACWKGSPTIVTEKN